MSRRKKKPWGRMTEDDIEKIWKERCRKCKYRGSRSGHGLCNYLIETGHSRGCRPDECTKFMEGARIKTIVRPKVNEKSDRTRKQRKTKCIVKYPALTYFGETLDKYMIKNNMQQKDFADYLGMKVSCISEWRRGKTKPKEKNLIKVCNAIGIELSEGKALIEKGML